MNWPGHRGASLSNATLQKESLMGIGAPGCPALPTARPGAPRILLAGADNRDRMVRELVGRPVAFAVATLGSDPWQAGARVRQVALTGTAGEVWLDNHPGTAVGHILRTAPAIIGHHLLADLLWLDKAGLLRLEDVEAEAVDVAHLAHLHDNRTPPRTTQDSPWAPIAVPKAPADDDAPGHGLPDLAAHHLGPDADAARRRLWYERGLPPSDQATFAKAWAALDDADPLLSAYAAAKADLTWRLVPLLRLRPGEDELVRLEARGAAIGARMRRAGYGVDLAQVRTCMASRERELAELRPLLRAVGVDSLGEVGRGYEQALRALSTAGASLTRRDSQGLFLLDSDVLDKLAADSPVAALLRRARRAQRHQRDYLAKMLNNRGVDGRLHPDINTLGTRTGRWTVSGALPMQQLPGNGGIRECVVADPGRTLVAYDYSSIEFTVLAAITGDPAMAEVIETGHDPHLAAADIIWPGTGGLPATDPVRKGRRDIAKQVVYGLGFGMGAAALADRSGLSLEQAAKVRDAWPGAHATTQRIGANYAQGELTVVSRFGRSYRIPLRNGQPVLHQALNNLTQGTARDLMMRDLITLENAGLQPWLTIHDEIVIEADQRDAERQSAEMKSIMQTDRHEQLGLPVAVKGGVVGPHWTKS